MDERASATFLGMLNVRHLAMLSLSTLIAGCGADAPQVSATTVPVPASSSAESSQPAGPAPAQSTSSPRAMGDLTQQGLVVAGCSRDTLSVSVSVLDASTGSEIASRRWAPAPSSLETGVRAVPTACFRGYEQTLSPDLRWAAASTPETSSPVHVGYLNEAGAFVDATAISGPPAGFSSKPVRDDDPKFDPVNGHFIWQRVNEQQITGRDVTVLRLARGSTKAESFPWGFIERQFMFWQNGTPRPEGAVYRGATQTYATGSCPEKLSRARDCEQDDIWIGSGTKAPLGRDVPRLRGRLTVVAWLDDDRLIALQTEFGRRDNYLIISLKGGTPAAQALLPPNDRPNKNLVVGPDGHSVAFQSQDDSGNPAVYRADANDAGAEPTLLGALKDDMSLLRWQ